MKNKVLPAITVVVVLLLMVWLVKIQVFPVALLVGVGIGKLVTLGSKKAVESGASNKTVNIVTWVFMAVLIGILVLLYSQLDMTPMAATLDFGKTFLKVILFNILLAVGFYAWKEYRKAGENSGIDLSKDDLG